jgi:hypothetical protein
MKNLKLTLAQIIRLKDILEKSIDEDNQSIINTNTITNIKDIVINIKEIQKNKSLKSEIIKELCLLIQTTNLQKTSKKEESIFYYIKTRSELKREREMIMSLSRNNILFPISIQTDMLKEIDEKISIIGNKLSDFNNTITIKLKYDELLKSFYKKIGVLENE